MSDAKVVKRCGNIRIIAIAPQSEIVEICEVDSLGEASWRRIDRNNLNEVLGAMDNMVGHFRTKFDYPDKKPRKKK